ncbi:superoxide dismutase [Gordonia hirsuta DSM 44140 = NBRC 16056]|uniref:Superoxide dismutase n=1 Tax=Gordonia hirsuta DSM 44140 = NBRC 16056 TaxID=1121927 RepID=L7L9Q9_9ACTN|nr:superoxide dismutase [Gordonia hirsuta]GAC57659.1 superoxide dismutase [Gordonia hirsuta DSM 44140 = NBRC 16056]
MAVYTLPDLDYDYGALEPHISGKIMELHHDKHHAAYVAGANTALEKMEEARDAGDIAGKVFGLSANLGFHLGGHTNHSIFWKNLSPNGGGEPEGDLKDAIDRDFGGFDKFKAHFTAAATTLQGSGWAILGYDTIGKRLVIEQLTDQSGNTSAALIPVVMLDMWEHAFYLDYQNVKPDYVKAWWNVVNWEDAAARYGRATAADGLIVPA